MKNMVFCKSISNVIILDILWVFTFSWDQKKKAINYTCLQLRTRDLEGENWNQTVDRTKNFRSKNCIMAKENGWFSDHPVLAIAKLSLLTYLQYCDWQPLEIFFWACDHVILEVDWKSRLHSLKSISWIFSFTENSITGNIRVVNKKSWWPFVYD